MPEVKDPNAWPVTDPPGTNESGFSAFPSGKRLANGAFVNKNGYAYWWSASLNLYFK